MHCFRSNGRSAAFTLIEVIAGLTLMATVLVGSLLAFAAHQKQRRFAAAKIAAVNTADEMLHVMSNSPDGIPATGRGLIPGQRNWFWQTSVVGAMTPAQVPMRVVRFEIMEQSSPGQIRALVTVDLLQPMDAG